MHNLTNRRGVFLVLLDLRATVDTVNHIIKLVLGRLASDIGIGGTVYQCFQSYLSVSVWLALSLIHKPYILFVSRFACCHSIKVRYCIYWENMPSSVPKLPLSMEPSRGKMMKSDNPAPDSLLDQQVSPSTHHQLDIIIIKQFLLSYYIYADDIQLLTSFDPSDVYNSFHHWCSSSYSCMHFYSSD